MNDYLAQRFKVDQYLQVTVTMSVSEHNLLSDLVSQLKTLISETDPEQPLTVPVDRLFGRWYEDPLENLIDKNLPSEVAELQDKKLQATKSLEETLNTSGTFIGKRWQTTFSKEHAYTWLLVIQDLRLVLSRSAGIETEEDTEKIDRDYASVLNWLGILIEELVSLFANDY